MTMLAVQHEWNVIRKAASRVVLPNENKTAQEANPDELCEHPKHQWTMQFLGQIQ